jgi:serine/threonine protein kinase/TolB-like protein
VLNSKSTKTTGKNRNEQPTRGIVSSKSEATPAITGKTLGAFEVGDLLGEGGMGAVFNGRDKALDRPVAIKVLHTKLAADEEFVERFVREARTAAKLNHTNVVQIYGAGYDDGIAYMALELVEGCSLFDLYKAQRPFPPRRACELIRDVSRGLAVAHEQGVIHRDIKPENILISEKGVPKLADFGLARASDQRITETGIFLGTPQYASPEQCNAAELTPASDLYSLGVVLYELLAGRPPYEAPTPLTLFKKILMESPEPLANYCPDLPPSLIALIDRLLEKDPAARYSDAAVLASDLDRVLTGLPEVSADMDPYKLVPIVHADSRTVQTPIPASSSSLPFQETRGTTPLGPQPGEPAGELGALKIAQFALAAVAAVLICAVIGLGLARLRRAPQPAVGPTAPVVQAPLRVAVIPWSNQAKSPDFEWLGRALPDFLVSQLSQRPDAILVEPPANVIDAAKGLDLSDPSQRRAMAQALGVDLVIGGNFYVGSGGKVVLNAQVETDEGMPKQIPGTPATFAKEEVLGALSNFAEALARAIAGPNADTSVVASAPAEVETQTARVDAAQGMARRRAESKQKGSVEVADRQEELAKVEKELGELTEREKRSAPVKKVTKEATESLALRTLNAQPKAAPETEAKGQDAEEDKDASSLNEDAPGDLGPGDSGPGDSDMGAPETGGGGGATEANEGDGTPYKGRRKRGGTKKDQKDKSNKNEKTAKTKAEDETRNWSAGTGDEQQRQGGSKPGSKPVAGKPGRSTPAPGSPAPAQDPKAGPQADAKPEAEKAALAPELVELRLCLEKGDDWKTCTAIDACVQTGNAEIIRGALEAIDKSQGQVWDFYRKKLRDKLPK